MKVHPIIRQVVDRCHVSEDMVTVLRYVISRLEHQEATYRALGVKEKTEFIRQVAWQHDVNRRGYAEVMYHRRTPVKVLTVKQVQALDAELWGSNATK